MTRPHEGAASTALLDDYDFELPEDLIAQTPAKQREEARLLVIDRASGRIVRSGSPFRVHDLPRFLRAGDLLVVNATRVLPAKLVGRKATGDLPGARRDLARCVEIGEKTVGIDHFLVADCRDDLAKLDESATDEAD